MCDAGTAILIATAVSAGTSIIQGQQQARIARQNQALLQGEMAIRNAQLAEEQKIAKLNAQEEEEQRKQLLRRSIATQRAYNRGLENNSFLRLIEYEEEALAKDIANLRLGLGVETSRLATEISVNTTRANQPSGASEIATAGFLQAAGTVAGGYADYSLTKRGRTNNTNTNTTSNFGGYGTQRNSNRQLGVK